MSRINISRIRKRKGARYPAPYAKPCANRERTPLGNAAGLTDFGVNLLRLPPGTWSSQRHWHDREEEFIYVLSGQVMLVTDKGETAMEPGDCAGFPKGKPDGHHLVNRSNGTAVCLEVGTRTTHDRTVYPDIDMVYDPALGGYAHRDGRPYPR